MSHLLFKNNSVHVCSLQDNETMRWHTTWLHELYNYY